MEQKHKKNTKISQAANTQLDFVGYNPPSSNVTPCPNQLLDILMPVLSGPALKILLYLIRRVFGWTDAFGEPQEEQIAISHSRIASQAGVTGRHIKPALEELERYNAIEVVRQAQKATKGSPGVVGLYEIKMDASGTYAKNLDAFNGFFDGEGHFTLLPDQIYDITVPSEKASFVKAILVIARHSIGWVSGRGQRRKFTRASLSFVQKHGNMSRATVVSALKEAVAKNHLVRLTQGVYGPDKAAQVAATYGLKWTDKQGLDYALQDGGPAGAPSNLNQVPSELNHPESTSQIELGTVESELEDHRPNSTRTAVQTRPETHRPIRTKQKTNKRHSLKQQQDDDVESEIQSLLQDQGILKKDATTLANNYPEKLIRQQVEWLPARNPRNPAGMLRRAIEEEWSAPIQGKSQNADQAQGETFAAAYYAGFAGNKGAPTAQPSSKEIESATVYVDQLLKMWPEANLVEDHGRRFGAYVREKKPTTKDFRTTFTMAIRLFGDEFYKDLNTQRVTEVKKRTNALRKAHTKKHIAAYRIFIESEEKRIQKVGGGRYSEFLEKRAEVRRRQERNQFYDDEQRQKSLDEHDNDRARLNDFLDFFATEVADFWTWDTEHNPEAFGKVNMT